MDKIVKDLVKAITESNEKKQSAYDTTATVKRVEDGVAWVHIPGGVDETPVKLTVNAVEGDEVQVRVGGGRAWIVGNASNPPTDDTRANVAQQTATVAQKTADEANILALSAKDAADTAWEWADDAHAAAQTAWNHADEARIAATEAKESAADAEASAISANKSANNALTQLSIVEDVVDVLSWISEHGTYKASTDTSVVAGKYYFTKSGSTYNVVTNPTGNPSTNGYYELDSIDEAVSNYVSSHLALTNQGLWVVKDNNGYKLLAANDGIKVYDPSGNLVSTFGENVTFSATRPQKIGGTNCYIEYYDSNNDGVPDSLKIVGASVTFANGTDAQTAIDSKADSSDIPTKVSELQNDSGYQNSTQVNSAITSKGYQTASQVSSAVSTGISNASVSDLSDGSDYSTTDQMNSAISTATSDMATNTGVANTYAAKTAAVAEEQYIYISKASGTSSVSGTTTWITQTGDKQNTWSTKRPTYNTSYPVLFVAKQKKTVSGTVTCTTPVKDDTTTVIDGGHITTGTIDASKATVTNINASNISSGTLSADRIEAGSIVVGKLATAVQNDISTAKSNASTALANAANAQSTADTALSQSVEYINGTQTAATGSWTGVTTDSALVAGKTIAYRLPYAGSGNASLNLTLSGGGTTGAKAVYWNNTRVTTHYPQYSVIIMTYNGTDWRCSAYNSDTINRTRLQNVISAAGAITASHVIVGTSSGYRDIASGITFDITYPILYAGTAIAAGATTGTRDNNFLQINGINLATSISGWTGTSGSTVYVVGTLSGNTFTIDSSVFTTTVPTSANGKYYIPIGLMYSTTQCYFNSSQQLYAYIGGKFQPVSNLTTSYITEISNGIKISSATDNTDYLQITSSAIEIYRNSLQKMYLSDSEFRLGRYASEEYNTQIVSTGFKIRKYATTLASFTGTRIEMFSGAGTSVFAIDTSGSTPVLRMGQVAEGKYNTYITSNRFQIRNNTIPFFDIGVGETAFPVTERTTMTVAGVETPTGSMVINTYPASAVTSIAIRYHYSYSATGAKTGSGSVTLTPSSTSAEWTAGTLSYALSGGNITLTETSTMEDWHSFIAEITVKYTTNSIEASKTTMGAYPDTSASSLLTIGNGTSSSATSNTFSVGWNGNIELSGTRPSITMSQTRSDSVHSTDVLTAYPAYNTYGVNLVMGGNGNTIIGAGESHIAAYEHLLDLNIGYGSEQLLLSSDNNVYIITAANTWSNNKIYKFDSTGMVFPQGTAIYGGSNYGEPLTGSAFEPYNASGNLTLGYWSYANSLGNVNIYGNNLNFLTKNQFRINGNWVFNYASASATATVYKNVGTGIDITCPASSGYKTIAVVNIDSNQRTNVAICAYYWKSGYATSGTAAVLRIGLHNCTDSDLSTTVTVTFLRVRSECMT